MSSINILDYNTIDISNIKFNKPNKGKGGSYMSPCDYNDTPIYIQTPRLISKKGVVRNDSRCTLDLEFDREHWKFYEFMTNVDDHNVIQIQKNSGEWFDKEFPLDIVEEFYTTPIKIGRGNKPPTLKIKIPIVKGELGCCIYNSNNNVISHNEVKVDSKILCVLKLHGLRYLKQQVICDWIPVQIKVFQKGQDSVYLINDNLLSDYEPDNKIKESPIEINNEPESYELMPKESVEEPVLESVDEPVLESVEEPVEPVEPVLESVEESVEEPVDSILESVEEPVQESVEEPIEPVLESVEEPVQESVEEPVQESVEEPVELVLEEIVEEKLESNNLNADNLENNTELELLKKQIDEKNLIIEDLQNKFIKLKDFIN